MSRTAPPHMATILTPEQMSGVLESARHALPDSNAPYHVARAGFTAASAGALAQVASSGPAYACPPGMDCFAAPPMLDYPVYPTGSPLSMQPLGYLGYSPYGYRSSPTPFFSMPG